MDSKFLSKGGLSVRLPISLNIIGKVYHLETSLISGERILLKIDEKEFDYIPPLQSNILLFLNLNLAEKGIIELKGKICLIENFTEKKGLWIQYETNSKSDLEKINEYIKAYYIPRYVQDIKVEVLTEKEFFQGRGLNISENGIFIETNLYPIHEDEICILNLFIENQILQMKSEISWINQGEVKDKPIGYGFKFIHNGQTRYKINNYLKTLKKNSEIIR